MPTWAAPSTMRSSIGCSGRSSLDYEELHRLLRKELA
jgi:hypothetical protein